MKYTRSKDGQMRATIRPAVRMTEGEIEVVSEEAKRRGQTFQEFMSSFMHLSLYHLLEEIDPDPSDDNNEPVG